MEATGFTAIILCGLAILFVEANAYSACNNHVEILDALEGNNLEEFKTLIEAEGTNGNCYVADAPVLIIALDLKRLDMIEYLVKEQNTDVNMPHLENGQEVSAPLFEAIMQLMSIDIIQMLVENGADVNAVNGLGASILTLAEYQSIYNNDYKAVVEYLVANGADTNLADNSGLSACDIALATQNQEMLNALNC